MFKSPRILDLAFDVHDLPPISMLILIKMARFGNTTSQVYASQQTLALVCNCSIRTVRRTQTLLRERGYITRIPNPKGSTDRYVLNFDRWDVSLGQRGRLKRSQGPLGGGQNVRQNHNLNHNLNQSRPASRTAHRMDGEMIKLLGRIEAKLAEDECEGSKDA